MTKETEYLPVLPGREWGNQRTARLAGWIAWQALKLVIEVPERSRENMAVMNEHLSDGNVVFYWAHSEYLKGILDVVGTPVVSRYFFPEMVRAVGPMRKKHHDGVIGRVFDVVGGGIMHVHAVSVYTQNDEVPQKEKRRVNDRYNREMDWQMMKPPGVLLGIAPSGTRDSELPRPDQVRQSYLSYSPEKGFGDVLLAPGAFVPVGMGRQILEVGEPFLLRNLEGDVEERNIKAMTRLADLLPDDLLDKYYVKQEDGEGDGGE